MSEPLYTDETFDTIMERMLARLPDDIDKREGSVVYDLLAPAAVELEQAYMEMDNVLNIGFIDTTYGEYIDRRAAEQGLTRKAAIKATGLAVFSGPDDMLIPTGTRISTDTPVYFVTTADATVVGGVATVPLEAETGGVSGNVTVGAITTVLDDLSGVVSVTNTEALTGGVDAETDAELIERYIEKVSRPITSGNKYQYESWAKEIAGIADARCYPLWNGPLTVKVVVINSEKRSPAQAVITQAFNYIEEQRPVGAIVTVVGVGEVSIDVAADLTLLAGVDINAVKTSIAENLTKYFKEIAFVDSVVRYTQVGNAVLDAPGVIDYANLTVNGTVANIALGANEVPVVGAVTVTQI